MCIGFVFHYRKLSFLFKAKLAYIHYAYISQVFLLMESLLPNPLPRQKDSVLYLEFSFF